MEQYILERVSNWRTPLSFQHRDIGCSSIWAASVARFGIRSLKMFYFSESAMTSHNTPPSPTLSPSLHFILTTPSLLAVNFTSVFILSITSNPSPLFTLPPSFAITCNIRHGIGAKYDPPASIRQHSPI
jgi:hypothetical protein